MLEDILERISDAGRQGDASLCVELCKEALSHVYRDGKRELYARLELHLGNALMRSPTGSHALNVEEAINAYQRAIDACTKADLTMGRVAALNELANAYGDRVLGNRLENAKQELSILRELQQILSRDREPAAWATVTMNIANALGAWPGADRADRMEESRELYEQVLEINTKDAMPYEWALANYNLATWYQKRIRGNRRTNLEGALKLHYDGLTVRTRVAYPFQWAIVMMAIGNTYGDLNSVDEEDRTGDAIEAYTSALSVLTREDHPRQWADVIVNIAKTYSEKVTGAAKENIERAIELYTTALNVLEPPSEAWANALTNRADCYLDRRSGYIYDNIERAIDDCSQVLRVIPREAAPFTWGRAAKSLANGYRLRRTGDRTENLERAITLLTAAVNVYSLEPVQKARILQQLAEAYMSRQIGGRAQNVEYAMAALRAGRSSCHREDNPHLWASITTSLANAYLKRLIGHADSNAKLSIRLFEDALKIRVAGGHESAWASTALGLASAYLYARTNSHDIERSIELYSRVSEVRAAEESWEEWALANHGLGISFSIREAGNRAENVEEAIKAYERALTVQSRENTAEWAHTIINVAALYRERERGDRAADLSRMLELLERAVNGMRSGSFPDQERLAARNLGDAYADSGRWQDAISAYYVALDAAERLYESSLVDSSKATELAANGDLYRVTAYALARTGRLEDAAVMFERGRARALAEAQVDDSAVLSRLAESNPDMYGRYARAAADVQQLTSEQKFVDPSSFASGRFMEDARTIMADALHRLKDVIEEIKSLAGYEEFLADPSLPIVTSGSAPGTPIVYVTTTDWGSLALVVRFSDPCEISPVFSESFTLKDIDRLFKGRQGLLMAHDLRSPEAMDFALSTSLPILGEHLIAPLAANLRSTGTLQVTIVAGGPLTVFPLHAAPYALNGLSICLIDEFDVAYAPSAHSICASREIVGRLQGQALTLFGLANPLPHPRPLVAANAELEQIAELFHDRSRHVFFGHDATREALASISNSKYAHFACHGVFDILDPLGSGLQLAGGETWSARDILASSAFKQTRLVVLSACQTAMVDFVEAADEVVGLSTSMLQAGAAGVVGTLRVVDDLSTSLVMTRFYHNHLEGDLDSAEPPMNPARALTRAQRWLRDLTIGELRVYLEQHLALRDVAAPFLVNSGLRPGMRPFRRPYSWAPFVLIGA